MSISAACFPISQRSSMILWLGLQYNVCVSRPYMTLLSWGVLWLSGIIKTLDSANPIKRKGLYGYTNFPTCKFFLAVSYSLHDPGLGRFISSADIYHAQRWRSMGVLLCGCIGFHWHRIAAGSVSQPAFSFYPSPINNCCPSTSALDWDIFPNLSLAANRTCLEPVHCAAFSGGFRPD